MSALIKASPLPLPPKAPSANVYTLSSVISISFVNGIMLPVSCSFRCSLIMERMASRNSLVFLKSETFFGINMLAALISPLAISHMER